MAHGKIGTDLFSWMAVPGFGSKINLSHFSDFSVQYLPHLLGGLEHFKSVCSTELEQ